MPTRSEPLQWGLQPMTVFFKYGEDERIGESVEAIGDEDAPAYIRQKMGVHVNPVIAHYDDPEDCKRKEQISEICLFAFDYVCQHVRVLIVDDQISQIGCQTRQSNPSQAAERQGEEGNRADPEHNRKTREGACRSYQGSCKTSKTARSPAHPTTEC